MKEKHYYKTSEGKIYIIAVYDDINKMVFAQNPTNTFKGEWKHDTEYKTWSECDAYGNLIEVKVEPDKIEIEEIEEPILEVAKPKIKKANKKKDATKANK